MGQCGMYPLMVKILKEMVLLKVLLQQSNTDWSQSMKVIHFLVGPGTYIENIIWPEKDNIFLVS